MIERGGPFHEFREVKKEGRFDLVFGRSCVLRVAPKAEGDKQAEQRNHHLGGGACLENGVLPLTASGLPAGHKTCAKFKAQRR